MIEDLPDQALSALPSYLPNPEHSARIRIRCQAALRRCEVKLSASPDLVRKRRWIWIAEAGSLLAVTVYLIVLISTATRLVAF